jgi:hypothetical protein
LAVIGESPTLASAEEGRELLEAGLTTWKTWVESGSAEQLEAHYKGVFDRYEAYMDAYFRGSWEDAMRLWWAEKATG